MNRMESEPHREVRRVLPALLLAAGLLAAPACAEAPAGGTAPGWGALEFLVGRWSAPNDGKPGSGSGEFDLAPELAGRILVRRSRGDDSGAGGRPTEKHSDLMVISAAGATTAAGPWHADYWDSEGHAIRYTVTASAGGDSLRFLSEPTPGAPTFRLTYARTGPDDMEISFEIELPGQTGFQAYRGGKAHRVK